MRHLVLGHRGKLGGELYRQLSEKFGDNKVVGISSKEVDLTDWNATYSAFRLLQPTEIWHAAGDVGGLAYNISKSKEILYNNAAIGLNVMHAADVLDIERVHNIASSCMYPIDAEKPLREHMFGYGKFERTNDGYAASKMIAYMYANMRCYPTYIPCNLYGVYDSYDQYKGHVIGALISKFCDAKKENLPDVHLLGTGAAKREFMTFRDAARAIIHVGTRDTIPIRVNIGTGIEIKIDDLAQMIKRISGYNGNIMYNGNSCLDGVDSKVLDVSKLNAKGFVPEDNLEDTIKEMVKFYESI